MNRYLIRLSGGCCAEFHAVSAENALKAAVREDKASCRAMGITFREQDVRVVSQEPIRSEECEES